MVDIFALALSHGLLALAAWRLLWRPELDAEGVEAAPVRKSVVMRTGRTDAGTEPSTGEQEGSDA